MPARARGRWRGDEAGACARAWSFVWMGQHCMAYGRSRCARGKLDRVLPCARAAALTYPAHGAGEVAGERMTGGPSSGLLCDVVSGISRRRLLIGVEAFTRPHSGPVDLAEGTNESERRRAAPGWARCARPCCCWRRFGALALAGLKTLLTTADAMHFD